MSSLLSPKVAQEREANRNGANFSAVAVSESNLPSNDVGPSAMYMNGTFQIVMYGSREQLDEDSGKFYTVRWFQNSTEHYRRASIKESFFIGVFDEVQLA